MKYSLWTILSFVCVTVSVAPGFCASRPQGYLAADEFDVTTVLEPAPRPGDPRYQTDREIFRATRQLKGTPRWMLATSDVDYSAPALLRDYSCAVGVALTPENAPKLVAVTRRAIADTGGQSGKAKEIFARQRPFTIDHGPVCQPPSELFDTKRNMMSYDYPSGHATLGWTWALILTLIYVDTIPIAANPVARPVAPAGLRPSARRAMERPSRRSSPATNSAAPTGLPLPSDRLRAAKPLSPFLASNAAKQGSRSSIGRTLASSSSTSARWARTLDRANPWRAQRGELAPG